ncbi:dihydrofolate reductase [Luteibacter pinisoli]|uniref:Dihydrofolate reductase n=1 Tax=Luteibacter pinisoli TaxID=2589080 RepID=A0A4Y5Z1E3_9GAMM|nr:dihydrofolate reductase family protein [Luteibacter pinisoli]QDE39130.1 dihydrofolate reductase [Luteibacter pinisoli]
MAKLVFAINQSLDGYVDHQAFAPGPLLFRHFIEDVRHLTGMVYGRGLYDVMRYWDDDDAGWDAAEREYAAVWRARPKWVVSRTLTSVGPNATLISDPVEPELRRLTMEHEGVIEVGAPGLVRHLAALGLIDEYRLYVHPVVVGGAKPCFTAPLPPLRLLASDVIGEDVIRLTYVPA